jgi:O-antigen/teichoic acid export membrane protein
MANVFTELGLQSSLKRYLAELNGRAELQQAQALVKWIYRRGILVVIAGAGLLALFTKLSGVFIDLGVLIPLAVLQFSLQGLSNLYSAYLIGMQNFRHLARLNVYSSTLLLLGTGTGTLFWGLPGAVAGYATGSLAPAFLSLITLKRHNATGPLVPELRRRVHKYALHTWLAVLVSAFVWSRAEIFFLGRYWSPTEVAMFTVGLSFAAMVSQTGLLLTGAFLPHLAELYGTDNKAAIRRIYQQGTRFMALLILPMGLGGAALMPVLIPAIYGPDFAPAVANATVLVALSAQGFSYVGSSLVYAAERSYFIVLGGAVGAILSLSGGFLIIPALGAWGAVWLRVCIQLCMTGFGTWFIVQRMGYSFPFRQVGKTAIAALVCGCAANMAVNLLGHHIASVLMAIPVGTAVYVLLLRTLHVLEKEDVTYFTNLAASFHVSIAVCARPFLDWIVRA